MKKIWLKEEIKYTVSKCDLEGSIESAISDLQSIKETYEEKGYRNLEIDTVYNYHCESLALFGERLETDAEFNRRMKKIETAKRKAKNEKERKEKAELKFYEKLKKKYE